VGALQRAFRAGALSALLPGAGQLYLGRRRRGVILLVIGLLPLIAAVVLWLVTGTSLLGETLRPSVLGALLVANGLLAAFRLFGVFDAYQLGRAQQGTGRLPVWARAPLGAVALLALAAVTIAPHAIAGYYNAQAYQTVTSIFGGGVTDALPNWADPNASASPKPQGAAPDTRQRLTILLLGGDAGANRVGLRTDTMIIASVEPATRQVTLIGLPRNLTQVPLPSDVASDFPGGRFPDLLNALYRYATEHPTIFHQGPDRGAVAVTETIEKLTALKIDYYALVDMQGFVDVVNALGGVTVRVTEHVTSPLKNPSTARATAMLDVDPGRYHFNGIQALAYVRSRHADDDYHRMRRQRCLLAGLASQTRATTLIRAIPKLLQVARKSVSTNIPASALPGLANMAIKLRGATVTTLGLGPPRYSGDDAHGLPVPRIAAIRDGIQTALHPSDGQVSPQQGEPVSGSSCV
jgi:polyisoprenyl-teichoic acid--peptidoglycan teichoic acid transferase